MPAPSTSTSAPQTLDDEFSRSARGLSSAEARDRLARYGPNEPTQARRGAGAGQLILFLTNPLVLILLAASIISALTGDRINALIIALMVVLSVSLNFVQTYRSQQAANRLREQVAPTATALRDGTWTALQRKLLVPGDVIRLSAGDMVPADARLIEAHDLHVQQAALTGESLPVEKDVATSSQHTPHITDALAQQVQSLADTLDMVFLGTSVISGTGIAVVTATGKSTAFGDIAARLAKRAPETEFDRGLRHFGFLILRTVTLLVLFVFLVSLVAKHDPLESLLFAIALAVGLTPEFLPMITTVTLGQGALHMSRNKVIVKHLAAIQNFGSMDILCSDKTGTLTTGDMVLDISVDPTGIEAQRPLQLARLNSAFETGIKSPLDAAILQGDGTEADSYTKRDEIPFDFERRRLSIVAESASERLLITKGAPESVLPICMFYESAGDVRPLGAAELPAVTSAYQRLSEQGYRTLAVAYRQVPQQAAYHVEDERELVLAGFLAFMDPPLEDAKAVLDALREDGVSVKILSGDNELVVHHICDKVGIDAGRIVLGSDLDRMGDTALAHIAEQTTVFARVSPAQKNRILLALKSRGHVVGFLGDGINDAPSLHAADVGISVASAVDVAKDAAEIILLEHSLRVLHKGILEGRKAFGNVTKYLLMGTSSNFGNMFSMAAASLFLPFLPMLPTQILLNNFLYDLSQVTIPTDNVDETFIIKPRRWDIRLIREFMIFIGPISSIYDFLTFFIMLTIFHASEALFHTGWFVESLATQTLVLFVIRTAGNPLKSRPSRPLTITTLSIVVVGMVLPFTPLAQLLGFVPLPALYFVFLAAMTATYLLLVQVVKRRLMRRVSY